MSHILQPNELLQVPAYWDGLDINHIEPGQVRYPYYEVLTQKTMNYAADMLLGTIRDALKGQFAEVELPLGPASKQSLEQQPDGTVAILQREELLWWDYSEGKGSWAAPKSQGPPIEKPFIPHWIQNQNAHSNVRPTFGSELARFVDDHQHYLRGLEWGVLVTTPNEKRVLPTWGFDIPRLTLDGISVAVGTEGAFRVAEEMPPLDGKAFADPPALLKAIRGPWWRRAKKTDYTATNPTIIHSLTRITDVHIIYGASCCLPALPGIEEFNGSRVLTKL